MTINSSIVFFNNALNQIANVSGTTLVTYSDVDQPNLGSTNIMTDPQFADTEWQFNLLPQSPAIDAGDPSDEWNDLYFPPSLGGLRNDMGAYGGPLARKWYRPLFVRPDSLNFGDVSLGDSLQSFVLLKNYGDADLTLNQITLGGSDSAQFSVQMPNLPVTIPMADSLRLPVVFHPRGARLLPFSAYLEVNSNVENRTVALSGRGVVADIFVMPTELDFPPTPVGQKDSLQLKIYNLGTDTLHLDSARVFSSAFSYRFSADKLAPQSDTVITMTVYFQPDTIADFQTQLDIFSNDPDESPLSVSLNGRGLAPYLEISPLQADFDSVRVLRDSLVTLFLRNAGNAELRIDSLALLHNTSQFSLETHAPLLMAAGADHVPLRIQFHADTAGFYRDTLRVVSNDPFRPLRLIPLSATATAPYIALSSSKIDFDTIIAPHDSVLSLTLKNSGNVPLLVHHFGLSGSDAASFFWWLAKGDLTVNPQDDSLVIKIRCAPQRSGLLQAEFNIAANDPRFDSLQVDLTAQAKAAEMALDPDTLLFPPTIILTSSERQIKIVNRGDYDLRIDSLQIDRKNGTDFQFPALQFPQDLRPQIDTLILRVGFAPQKTGRQEARLRFFSNDPFVNPRTVSVKGQGVTPLLSASVDSLNFGAISLFRRPVVTLLLRNEGSATAIIDTLSVVNDPAHAFRLPDWSGAIQIAPSDSFLIPVAFVPPNAGAFHSVLRIHWNDPYQRPLLISLKAQADSAYLAAPAQIDFGKQAVHSVSLTKLAIRNNSRVVVQIDSLQLTGRDSAQFKLDLNGVNLILQPSDTLLELPVEYVPHALGVHRAQLLIFSADLQSKMLAVSLHGIALPAASAPLLLSTLPDSVNFGSVFVNENKQEACVLINVGNAPLHIDSIAISGEDRGDFSTLNAPRQMQLAANDSLTNFAIRFTPQTAGERKATLSVFSNDARSPMQFVLYGQGKIDPTPATVTPTFDSLHVTAGKDFTVSIRAMDDSTTIRQAQVFVKQGGQTTFRQLAMEKKADASWQAVIDSNLVSMRGLALYFKVYHGGRVTLFPANGAQQPLAVQVRVPHADYPYEMQPEKYRMISLPLESASQTLADLFTDDLGGYDPSSYRFFDWDATQKKFTELNKMDKILSPGKAFYLITADSVRLDVDNVRSVPAVLPFVLHLAKGWNMIGDPFAFPVAWQNVQSDKNLTLFYFNGAAWEIADTLVPFKGYAVKAPENMTVQVAPLAATARMAKLKSSPENGWRFRLKVRSGSFYDDINFAGVRDGAKEGRDSFDIPEPPVIGTFVSLYFTDKDQIGPKWTADFRPGQQDGYRFDFTICSNTGKTIQLDLQADSLPAGFEWCVVSPQNGVRYAQLPIQLHGTKQNLRLLVGKKDFVKAELAAFRDLPRQFRLHQNYPNPFNSRTTIQVDLPAADRLSIVIYDITGRKVKTLSKRRVLEAGYHTFIWDGTDRFGIPVASGIYFIHLQGRKFRADRKIILQK